MSRYGFPERPRVAVVVASASRPELVGQLLHDLQRQTHPGVVVKVAVPDEASAPAPGHDAEVIVHTVASASAQRNAGVRAASDADVYFFFDDDAVPRDDYVASALRTLAENPDVVALTGRVIADGASPHVPEVTHAEALALLDASTDDAWTGRLEPAKFLYGCNMAVRALPGVPVTFDERLPLYSWLEDLDLTMRLKRHGRVVVANDCVAVHLGHTSGGRTAHTRLGYSHIMNPVYLWRKGTLPARHALELLVPRLGKNLLGLALTPAERPWRTERFRGHALAVLDIIRGRITPERITAIPR